MKRVVTGSGILVLTVVLGGIAGAVLWTLTVFVSGPPNGLSPTLTAAGLVVLTLGWLTLAWWYARRSKGRAPCSFPRLCWPVS